MDKLPSITSPVATPSSLHSFFAFNAKLGQKEGQEHEKILLFHANGKLPDISEQTKTVGLCEALINFTKTFAAQKPTESLHTQKKRQVFFSPEPEYWFVLCLNNPYVTRGTVVEWLEEDLDDTLLLRLLRNIHGMFALFNGPLSEMTVEESKKRLSKCIPHILADIDFENCNIFTALDGVSYLPLDKNVFLRVQCMVNQLENALPEIKYSCFFFREQIGLAGFEQEALRIVYNALLPILTPRTDKLGILTSFINKDKGTFLLGLSESNPGQLPPRIYLQGLPTSLKLHLILYQRNGITMGHIVDASVAGDAGFYSRLLSLVQPQLEFLAPIIAEHYAKKMNGPTDVDGHRFIYFNHMNLAMKTSVRNRSAFASQEIQRVLNQLHADFEGSTESVSEVLVRLSNDAWVVGRKADAREFYVMIDNTSANLTEVTEEVRKLSHTHFNNIFLDWV